MMRILEARDSCGQGVRTTGFGVVAGVMCACRREEIDQVARDYGAFAAPVPTGGHDYLMDHSGFILLMGPAGEYVTHFESDVQAAQLVEELERRVEP